MKTSLPTLKTLLMSNVAEIKFFRKRPKPGFPPTRRMLCTSSFPLLNSPEGRIELNYRPPKSPPKINMLERNVLVTWDIFMQDYRCINMAACNLISVIPANKEFWKFFNQKIARLSSQQKINFMNK